MSASRLHHQFEPLARREDALNLPARARDVAPDLLGHQAGLSPSLTDPTVWRQDGRDGTDWYRTCLIHGRVWGPYSAPRHEGEVPPCFACLALSGLSAIEAEHRFNAWVQIGVFHAA